MEFSKRAVKLCKALSKNIINNEFVKQIIRAACSVGANYREANESLTKKDLKFRISISRKEAKETEHWLELIKEANHGFTERMKNLFQEVREIRNILSAMIDKTIQK